MGVPSAEDARCPTNSSSFYPILPVLMVGLSQGDVRIESSLLQILILSDRQGSLIDLLIRPDSRIGWEGVDQIGSRIEKGVTNETDRITEIRRAEEGPVDIEGWSHAPDSQGQAEVLLFLADVKLFSCRIQKAGHAKGCIEKKACCFVSGTLEFCLEQAVDQADGRRGIGEEIVHTDPCLLRDDSLISGGDGLENPKIELVVHVKKEAIDRLEGI